MPVTALKIQPLKCSQQHMQGSKLIVFALTELIINLWWALYFSHWPLESYYFVLVAFKQFSVYSRPISSNFRTHPPRALFHPSTKNFYAQTCLLPLFVSSSAGLGVNNLEFWATDQMADICTYTVEMSDSMWQEITSLQSSVFDRDESLSVVYLSLRRVWVERPLANKVRS